MVYKVKGYASKEYSVLKAGGFEFTYYIDCEIENIKCNCLKHLSNDKGNEHAGDFVKIKNFEIESIELIIGEILNT